jgi:hypothetical protein
MAKVAFNKKKKLFINKLKLNVRKKPVKCYTWNTALYGAETCDTSEKLLQNSLAVLKCVAEEE